ncbi:glycosyltransferase WbuB [Cryobacterium flavum]|nr:glycosyltransferase [Cryobacterium flavum]TFB77227.1 glycosyltransferase WbuB [Cryobacterium flavum]
MLTHLQVAILGLNYPPEQSGISPYTGSLAKGLNSSGFDVTVITAHPHYPTWAVQEGYGQWTRRETIAGVQVVRLRHFVPRSPTGASRLVSEISFGLRTLFARWHRPSLVILVSPALFAMAIGIIRAKLSPRRPAIIVWVQDLYSLGIAETGTGGRFITRVARMIESIVLRTADRVVVIHPRFASYVSESLSVDPSRIAVIRNWSHVPYARNTSSEAARNLHGWRKHETVALHAGNMGVKQGLENVIEAARLADAEEHSVRFVLLGDGSRRAQLEAQASGLTRLQFLDPLEGADFPSVLAAADILLVNEMPGVSEMAVPSKLTSYFSAGRAVVAATDPSGTTAGEVHTPQGGLIVPSGNPRELLEAILHLRSDTVFASTLGKNGLQYRLEVLGEEGAINSFTGLIEGLIQERQAL